MREEAGDSLDNEKNSIDRQNQDENFSVLLSQGVQFFRFCVATGVHDANPSSRTATSPGGSGSV
jgi:hypothetical protein